MDLVGSDELIKRLEKATEAIQIQTQTEITGGAKDIAEEAKLRAPGDFGILKGLISFIPAEKSQNGYDAEVVSAADYSAYVEFGTGTKVDVPGDLTEFALQFKGTKAVPGMRAQPFFFPAAKRIFPIIKDRIQKILDKL